MSPTLTLITITYEVALGFDVLLSDADTAWRRDPRPWLSAAQPFVCMPSWKAARCACKLAAFGTEVAVAGLVDTVCSRTPTTVAVRLEPSLYSVDRCGALSLLPPEARMPPPMGQVRCANRSRTVAETDDGGTQGEASLDAVRCCTVLDWSC